MKTIPFTTAHPYRAHILPPPGNLERCFNVQPGQWRETHFSSCRDPQQATRELKQRQRRQQRKRQKKQQVRACLHGGGGPQTGEVTCGGLPHLSSKHDQIEMRDYMNRRVTPPKRFTSPNWGPPPKEQLCTLFCTFLCRHCMIMQERCVHIRTYARGLLVEI